MYVLKIVNTTINDTISDTRDVSIFRHIRFVIASLFRLYYFLFSFVFFLLLFLRLMHLLFFLVSSLSSNSVVCLSLSLFNILTIFSVKPSVGWV